MTHFSLWCGGNNICTNKILDNVLLQNCNALKSWEIHNFLILQNNISDGMRKDRKYWNKAQKYVDQWSAAPT